MRIIAIALVLVLSSVGLTAQNIIGKWKTVDDEDGETKSIVTISESNGAYVGHISKILKKESSTICTECKGEKNGQPMLGLEIIWDMKPSKKNVYKGGTILDPRNGKEYSCKLTVDGDKLKVRGYIGSPLLGRTQVWQRVK